MTTFDETLKRVLNPDGVYWTGVGQEEDDDPALERTIELRVDVPLKQVSGAILAMELDGWTFTQQPDDSDDPQQRLFFQRHQNLLPRTKITMLTDALRIVFPIAGARLWTWMVIDEDES